MSSDQRVWPRCSIGTVEKMSLNVGHGPDCSGSWADWKLREVKGGQKWTHFHRPPPQVEKKK